MKYNIKIKSPYTEMYNLFLKEKLTGDRCTINIQKKEDHVLFDIEADDSVALRATLNAITKLFTVYEKTKKL